MRRAAEGRHLAYQVLGEGPIDLIYVPDWWNHIEAQWEAPALERFLHRLASFSRLILFDKRGMGASDPVSQNALPTLEDWIEDVQVVTDATDCQRAAVFASSGGGPMGLLFAATYPQRMSALILVNTAARITAANDYPIGVPARVMDNYLNWLGEKWGTPAILDLYGPSVAADVRFRQWFARYLRLSQSPGIAVAVQRMLCELDLRQVLPTISCPTLVMHRTDDRAVNVALGRYLAAHIEGSKYVELAGQDHSFTPVTPTPWLTRSKSSSPERTEPRSPIAFWPRCCLQTSSARPSVWLPWATVPGAICLTLTIGTFDERSSGSGSRGEHHWRWILRHLRRTGSRNPLRLCDSECDAGTGNRGASRPAHRRGRVARR